MASTPSRSSQSTLMEPEYTFAASVSDAVLNQFKDYSRSAVETGNFVVDATYDKILQGLQIVAPQAGSVVLDTILRWRAESLTELGNLRTIADAGSVLRKRLVVESLFLEAALRLVGLNGVILAPAASRELENLAFDWIMHADSYVDGRFQESHRLRDRVVLAASQLLGQLSTTALDFITERFLKELAVRIKAEANSAPRQELYALCQGLRFLRVYGDTPAQLRSAINFLERMFPLKHVAPDKKSRLQQAIADALTSALAPLADFGDPGAFGASCDPALRKQWFATVGLLRTELLRWTTKQSKQATAGLPAVTVLTCIEDENALVGSIDSLVELLHKQLKDKKTASMGILCLVRCVACFLRRLRGRSDLNRLVRWVARAVAPVVEGVARGHLLAPEQLELTRQLCTVVAATLPEYGVQGMVLELLAVDGSQPWEASMAGLVSLMSILAEAPARLLGNQPVPDLPATASALEVVAASAATGPGTVWNPPPEACGRLLEFLKGGHHPLEAYGLQHLIAPVSAAVGRLLAQCHQLHGYTRLTNASTARAVPDVGSRERMSALPVFAMVLQTVPYIIPDSWADGGLADDLPGYAIHAEPSMRTAAVAALHRCLAALPSRRDALVSGMATFVVRLQEEFTDVIGDSLRLLLGMLREWDRLATVDAAMSAAAGEPAPSPNALGTFGSIGRVEGAALGLLCSADVGVRRAAVELLRSARALHISLKARLSPEPTPTTTGPTSVGAATPAFSVLTPAASARSSMYHSVTGSISFDPPPLLTLPQHVRRSTAASFPALSGAHHVRRSTLGSIPTPSAFLGDTIEGGSMFSPASGGAHNHHGPAPLPSASSAQATSVSGQTDSQAGANGISYVADIIDRRGDAIALACHWDYGPWSDLWREWRPVPEDASFEAALARPRAADSSQGMRWARILCEISREVWRHCNRSAWCVHLEVTAKLQALTLVDASNRSVLPQEGLRGELARSYALVAAAAPYIDASKLGEKGLISRELVRLMVSSARSGVDFGILALGCMHPTCHMLVVTEVATLVDEYSHPPGSGSGTGSTTAARSLAGGGRGGSRGRRDDARLVHAHVLRTLSSNLPPETLVRSSGLRDRLVEFIADTARYITLTGDVSPELQQIRYCLCGIARSVASQLAETMPQVFPPMLRKQLYDKFSLYCEEGQTPGLFRSELRRHIAAAKGALKGRDSDAIRTLEVELVDSAEMLEHAAAVAMAAMQSGPLFDSDAGNPNGRVFSWIDRMLVPAREPPAGLGGAVTVPGTLDTTWGPPKEYTARTALRNLLRSNAELAPIFLDRCYSPSPRVAMPYFLVLSEVYSSIPLPLEEHVVLALVLLKVVDPTASVRTAARGMLGTLARRHWATSGDGGARRSTLGLKLTEDRSDDAVDGAVVVSSLAESHQAYQQHLSASLAREHAELAHLLVMEVLNRHQGLGGAIPGGGDVLLCLPPWLEYASFDRGWEGHWGEGVLRSLYATTSQAQSGARRATQVQALWATVASNRRNLMPTLDFLLSQTMAESNAQPQGQLPPGALNKGSVPMTCVVGKQVALYLSRVAPRQTIDHLALEAALQITEPDGKDRATAEEERPRVASKVVGAYTPRAPKTSTGSEWVKIKEFHHRSAIAPLQQPLPRQQPLAAHAAAAVAAATASSSKPLTPSSIALAIKRSTVDLIIKTGAAVADTVAVAGAAAVGISASGLSTPGSMPRGVRASMDDGSCNSPEQQRQSLVHSAQWAASVAAPSPPVPIAAPPPPPRTNLTRPEVALCLLSEIACERDEELRPHLAILLHVAVLHADAPNAFVRQEACQVLQYLLYSLAYKPLEGQAAAAGTTAPSTEYARVAGVIGYLQGLGIEPLWAWELPTLTQPWVASAGYVAAFVQLVADCFFFDGALKERWSAEALKWACCAASRHAASRSHQVFCALSPVLSSAACTALLAALQKCLAAATAEGLDTAVEVMCTLRVLLANTPSEKLILYPHLLVACVALLCSSVVRIGELAAAMFIELIDALDLSSPVVQQAILSVLPLERQSGDLADENRPGSVRPIGRSIAATNSWILGQGLLSHVVDVEDDEHAGGPWLALQQLLVKGMFQPDTEALALEGMAAVARQIASAGARGRLSKYRSNDNRSIITGIRDATNIITVRSDIMALSEGLCYGDGYFTPYTGIEALVGAAEVGLAISLSSALPWMCVHVGAGELADTMAGFLSDTAAACAAIGWEALAATLAVLAGGPPPGPPGMGYTSWLSDFADIFAGTLFPTFSKVTVQRLIEAVQRGDERYQSAALSVLCALFSIPGLDLGAPDWFAEGSHLVELLSSEVSGPMGPRALEALAALAAFRNEANNKGNALSVANHEIDATGVVVQIEWRQCMDDLGESNKVCAEGLRRVVDACPGSAELLTASSVGALKTDKAKAAGGGTPSNEMLLPFLPGV